VLAPLAWLKLQFLLHAGDTEIGAFGVSHEQNLLYVEDLAIVSQRTTSVSVEFDDTAVADLFDQMTDRGLPAQRFMRIWIHTHPGDSAQPSGLDEQTFTRVFGSCDWALMFIIARTGEIYARLRANGGPGAELLIPVRIDWPAWPGLAYDMADNPRSRRRDSSAGRSTPSARSHPSTNGSGGRRSRTSRHWPGTPGGP
jgi:proteasome lid subunit RPN8/RPN11